VAGPLCRSVCCLAARAAVDYSQQPAASAPEAPLTKGRQTWWWWIGATNPVLFLASLRLLFALRGGRGRGYSGGRGNILRGTPRALLLAFGSTPLIGCAEVDISLISQGIAHRNSYFRHPRSTTRASESAQATQPPGGPQLRLLSRA
jgi:hypothetical protein